MPSNKSESARNPKWARDEVILALDLYLRTRPKLPSKTSREVRELSAALNQLGQTLHNVRNVKFRNINGAYMKLMNFLPFDPGYEGVGLTRGSAGDRAVWDEFAHGPDRCHEIAQAIRRGLKEPGARHPSDLEADDLEAEEGRILTRIHRTRERNRKLVAARKAQFLKKHGRLFCEACGFDFQKAYGERGQGIIDAHHTKPVSDLPKGKKTSAADLALLCANCHRVIHAARPWLTVEKLRTSLS